MAYVFAAGSSQALRRTGAAGAASISLWFYPTNSGLDCTLYAEHNGAGTQYHRIHIKGSTDDTVELASTNGVGTGMAFSVGTVNYNAWNHVFAARGTATPGNGYISLNGEALVTGSFAASGALTGTSLGRLGSVGPTSHYTGRIAEVYLWDNCLSDFDDRWKNLAYAFPAASVPVDANDSEGSGLGMLNLISDSSLIGNANDKVTGGAWILVNSPTLADHPRMHRQMS